VNNISTATLQGLFLYNKDDVEGAIAMVDQLAESVQQQQRLAASLPQ
jgi:chaperone BCS1